MERDKVQNIAITGSKGKTSILSLVEWQLLSKRKSVLSFKSVDGVHYQGKKLADATLQNYLTDFEKDYDFMLSEATSKLLKEGKYMGTEVDIAVFTGIEKQEHMEVHHTFEDYFRSKKLLFDWLPENGIALINKNSFEAAAIVADCKGKVISFGENPKADCVIEHLKTTTEQMEMSLSYDGEKTTLHSPLLGNYNLYNIAAAYLICRLSGIDTESFQHGLSSFKGAPGRFQRFHLKDNLVVVDYAHTVKSLKEILTLLNQLYRDREIVTVFGCGGSKSREKRPSMGRIVSELSDHVYITEDNPRYEFQEDIAKEIVEGIEKTNYTLQPNRLKAIETALSKHKNAVVLIAGKGAENHIKIREKKLRFSDIEAVQVCASGNPLRKAWFSSKLSLNRWLLEKIISIYSELYS